MRCNFTSVLWPIFSEAVRRKVLLLMRFKPNQVQCYLKCASKVQFYSLHAWTRFKSFIFIRGEKSVMGLERFRLTPKKFVAEIRPNICCFFINLVMNYFTFNALHSVDKLSNKQQIFGLTESDWTKLQS